MKKALFYLPVTLGIAVGGVSLLSSTAYADDYCPSGYSCYYDAPDATAKIWTAPGPGCYDLAGSVRDRISSVINRGGGTVHLYNWDYIPGGVGYVATADIPVNNYRNLSGYTANNSTDRVCIDP
jgi:hypothetical protein